MNVRVVKIGGAALADPAWLASFGAGAAAASTPLVVVHGGGPEISALSERLGVSVAWSNGRRVTPPDALDVASMVLNGRVNKRIVAALLGAGADALGLSGEDGGLIAADMAEGGALGLVGRVAAVRSELLEWLLARGLIPVIAPISRGPSGEALNVNADEVAAAVAIALGASELVFVTDVAGVRDASGAITGSLSVDRAETLLECGVAAGGMAVKLRAALDALRRGVAQVRIGNVGVLQQPGAGTVVLSKRSEVAA